MVGNILVLVNSSENLKILDWGEDGIATAAEAAALWASFQQEVAVWHKFDHPNIPKTPPKSLASPSSSLPRKLWSLAAIFPWVCNAIVEQNRSKSTIAGRTVEGDCHYYKRAL
ncbi:hypothetical protein ACFX2G_023328 [Malus domestica]